jgi:hypothetical protein
MIAASTVPFEDHDAASKPSSRTSTQWCQICGQSVPHGVSVCYGCDVEMGVGDWPSRPRRQADRQVTFRGFGRKRGRIKG